jgi:hypothetical protein
VNCTKSYLSTSILYRFISCGDARGAAVEQSTFELLQRR